MISIASRSRRLHRRCLVALSLALTACAEAQTQIEPRVHQESQDSDTTEPRRLALLIGITDYLSSKITDLPGAVNDVETMSKVLTTRFGFAAHDIVTLVDGAATRSAILAALERLVERSRPGDAIYVHFSGHGSQVADRSGDEMEDDLDETLVPADGRMNGVPDITDDELGKGLSALPAESLVVVLDCCHSGTGTRSIQVRTRSLPPDDRLDLYPEPAFVSRAIVTDDELPYLVLTGAASSESALDGPLDGRHHGLFTYALAKSLGQLPTTAPRRELMNSIEQVFREVEESFGIDAPEPQMEGPRSCFERPLFATTTTSSRPQAPADKAMRVARRPWLNVRTRDGGIILVDGETLGAAPGSEWEIHPPGELEFDPGTRLARAVVEHTDSGDAIARLVGDSIEPGSRAVLLAPAPAPATLPVHVSTAAGSRDRDLEAALLACCPDIVRVVAADEFARFVLRVDTSRCVVYGADGQQQVAQFPAADRSSLAQSLAAFLRRSHRVSELLALDRPNSNLELDFRVAAAPDQVKMTDRGIQGIRPSRRPRFFPRAGDDRRPDNSLQLSITASEDCFITIVDVDAEGVINVLFPNGAQRDDYHPDGRLRGGVRALIPDSLESGNRAGFHWDCVPPAGTDTLRVFAATDLETATMLRERIASIGRSAGTSRSAQTPTGDAPPATGLASLRNELLPPTRGFGVVADLRGSPDEPDPNDSHPPLATDPAKATGTWAAATLTVIIGER